MNKDTNQDRPIDWGAVLNAQRIIRPWKPGENTRSLNFCVDAWLESPHCRSLSQETQANYRRHCHHIRGFALINGDPDPTYITQMDAANFIDSFDSRSSLKVQVHSQFKRVMDIPKDLGWRPDNPVHGVHVKALEARTTLWSEDDVDDYVQAANEIGLPVVGNMIQTEWQTGQRLADIRKLRTGIEFHEGYLRHWCVKTGAYVSVPISEALSDRLAQVTTEFLFPHRSTGQPYTAAQLTVDFSRVRSHVPGSDERRLRMQCLRHSYIFEAAIHGATAYEIAAVTGHAYSTVHDLLAVYLPSDSRFAQRVQMLRGFVPLGDARAELTQEELVAKNRKRSEHIIRSRTVSIKLAHRRGYRG